MKRVQLTKENTALSLILLLSAILNFANISINGYANEYYAAGVKSMTMNLKNFFFVSFDPAGFVTIDKPPLGFWLQAISAKIFGFSGWSIILPQALAGVLSIAVLYYLVKRSFGITAGLVSALCLTITPIFVAVSRNNTVDNILVFILLLACFSLSIAAEKGNVKYLLLSLILVGIGFNIKMLQAYMVAPAIYITYLLSSSISIKKRVAHLAFGTAILLLVSFSWAFIVDLVPAENRPFIGSSTNNSVMELIIGHNGLERLGIGTSNSPGNRNANKGRQATYGQQRNIPFNPVQQPSSTNDNVQSPNIPGNSIPSPDRNENMPERNGSSFGGSFGGTETASITRLFSKNSLSDQIIWFFPLAVIGLIAAIFSKKLSSSLNTRKKLSLLLWSAWLIPEFIYFSYTKGLFHPYYLTMMAPPIAALAGIGITTMWDFYKEDSWKSWFLPITFILNGLVQLLILSYYTPVSSISYGLMIALSLLCFASSILLITLKLLPKKDFVHGDQFSRIKKLATIAALLGLFLAPALWSSTSVFYKSSGTFPSAGLSLMTNSNMEGPAIDSHQGDENSKMIDYLEAHKTTEKYLLVVPSAMSASNIILQSGESVMALGGFSGSDKILTLDQFKTLVQKGILRYAMVDGGGGPNGSNEIITWIKENGKVISESAWNGSSSSSKTITTENSNKDTSTSENRRDGGFPGRLNSQIYDLKVSSAQ